MDINTILDLYPCAYLCSPGDKVEILNKIDSFILKIIYISAAGIFRIYKHCIIMFSIWILWYLSCSHIECLSFNFRIK